MACQAELNEYFLQKKLIIEKIMIKLDDITGEKT